MIHFNVYVIPPPPSPKRAEKAVRRSGILLYYDFSLKA